jgi:hypothetical protein
MTFPVGHAALQGTSTGLWAGKPAARPCTTHADFRARCDSVLNLFEAERAPAPLPDERLPDYRRRLLERVQPYSHDSALRRNLAPRFLNDELLDTFEAQLYDETVERFKQPTGPLRMVTRSDDSGRKWREFFGDPAYCWDEFKPAVCQRISGIDPRAWNFGRGGDAPGAPQPTGVLWSDGSVRSYGL